MQVAYELAYIANKGWYYIPHVVDSIEGGDKWGLLDKYKEKHVPINIPDSIFESVHEGMQGVMESGTGRGAKVPGIAVCGKTGTVENYFRGVKQPNHSFFCAFAPRENPKIAIMCVVENSGRYGGTYAAPIVSLMIEKYINDTIAANRKPLEERMANTSLIPPLMQQKIKTRDSLQRIRDEERKKKEELKLQEEKTERPADKTIVTGNKPASGNTPRKDSLPAKDTKKAIVPGNQRQPANDKKDSTRK